MGADGTSHSEPLYNDQHPANVLLTSTVPQRTMVKVEIVEEKDQEANEVYSSRHSSAASSSVESLASSIGDEEETFYERIAALADIVPPTTRHKISSQLSSVASWTKAGGKLLGNLVWIATTSALLVGLPLALSLEDEAKIVAQEKEMLAQQQGAQQVRGRGPVLVPLLAHAQCAHAWDGRAHLLLGQSYVVKFPY